jgi:hypothetical protein
MKTPLACALILAACASDPDGFTSEPEDEAVDPDDPPVDPDPIDATEGIPTDVGTITSDEQAIAIKASCPKRSRTLSPKGLTFVIHISKDPDNAQLAYQQLSDVRHLIRPRDIFMIERKSPVLLALRQLFPCNDFHFIAYPEELGAAYDAVNIIDGIAVDWERGLWAHPQSWTVDKLTGYAAKIHDKHLAAGAVPYWPQAFNDGHITNVTRMNYELAQIQDHCAKSGAASFAAAARGLVGNFLANGLSPRDVGFEISLNSYADATNHTGVDPSVACTRKAYGRGARAIYLYGNGHPHLAKYFRALAHIGLRVPQ